MPQPFRTDSVGLDLHHRFQHYTTVDASPSAGTETVIATLALSDFGDLAMASGVIVVGWAAFTVGTSGVSGNLQIKQTNAAGTAVAATGAVNAGTWAATNLAELTVIGFDAAPGKNQYALTLTVASGAAASTVSALFLGAFII